MKWNKTFSLALFLMCCCLAAPAAQAETQIAVLDVARVFEEYEMTRDLEEMFDAKRRAAADEAEQRRGSIEQMRRALAAFDPDSDDFARREEDLTRAQIDFEVWSGMTERRLKNDHKKWLQKIYRNAQRTIAQLAEERHLDLVLTYDELTEDAPDSVTLRQQILLQKVIYHSDRIDLTGDVLDRLNQSYRADGGARSLQDGAQSAKPQGNTDKQAPQNQ